MIGILFTLGLSPVAEHMGERTHEVERQPSNLPVFSRARQSGLGLASSPLASKIRNPHRPVGISTSPGRFRRGQVKVDSFCHPSDFQQAPSASPEKFDHLTATIHLGVAQTGHCLPLVTLDIRRHRASRLEHHPSHVISFYFGARAEFRDQVTEQTYYPGPGHGARPRWSANRRTNLTNSP
jgi:hypothetical protein